MKVLSFLLLRGKKQRNLFNIAQFIKLILSCSRLFHIDIPFGSAEVLN